MGSIHLVVGLTKMCYWSILEHHVVVVQEYWIIRQGVVISLLCHPRREIMEEVIGECKKSKLRKRKWKWREILKENFFIKIFKNRSSHKSSKVKFGDGNTHHSNIVIVIFEFHTLYFYFFPYVKLQYYRFILKDNYVESKRSLWFWRKRECENH